MNDVTRVLNAVASGSANASSDLLPLVYDELRRLAAVRMARQAEGQTLQPTALVHEAWLRLVADGDRSWQNRAHFFRAAAQAMRCILVDKARHKASLKAGGNRKCARIEELDLATVPVDDRVLLVDEALEQLEAEDDESARIITLKFFGGLTNAEVARTLEVTERTVERQWAYAKVRLFEIIQKDEGIAKL